MGGNYFALLALLAFVLVALTSVAFAASVFCCCLSFLLVLPLVPLFLVSRTLVARDSCHFWTSKSMLYTCPNLM